MNAALVTIQRRLSRAPPPTNVKFRPSQVPRIGHTDGIGGNPRREVCDERDRRQVAGNPVDR